MTSSIILTAATFWGASYLIARIVLLVWRATQ